MVYWYWYLTLLSVFEPSGVDIGPRLLFPPTDLSHCGRKVSVVWFLLLLLCFPNRFLVQLSSLHVEILDVFAAVAGYSTAKWVVTDIPQYCHKRPTWRTPAWDSGALSTLCRSTFSLSWQSELGRDHSCNSAKYWTPGALWEYLKASEISQMMVVFGWWQRFIFNILTNTVN